MELRELREKSKNILANFLDEIGLNGEFYASTCNCPMAWGIPKSGCGEFITPKSGRMEKFIRVSNYDEKTKRGLNQRGLILISRAYKQKGQDSQLFITTMHEMIHSNRNLLLFDAVRENKNEYAYTYNNGKFEQNTSNYDFSYADASQEILKGRIDTSRNTVDSYKGISSSEIEDMDFEEGKRDSQMEKQYIIDEALIEVMSYIAYKRYSLKQKNQDEDIWTTIDGLKNMFREAYNETLDEREMAKSVICEIVLKHHDFDLFNWMVDPISYSKGDMHYDFFSEYTKNDGELLGRLYNLDINGDFELSLKNNVVSQNQIIENTIKDSEDSRNVPMEKQEQCRD